MPPGGALTSGHFLTVVILGFGHIQANLDEAINAHSMSLCNKTYFPLENWTFCRKESDEENAVEENALE